MRNLTHKTNIAGYLTLLVLAAVIWLAPQTVEAVGTTSGTTITNQATLNFTVGGVDQTAILSDGDTGTGGIQTTDFLVDTKIDLTVATVDVAAVPVSASSSDQVLTFTVTNTGNETQDFSLLAVALTGGTGAFGDTDTFDMTSVEVFADSNANGTYDAGTDTATYIDELAADTAATVFIVADTPAGVSVNDLASYHLVATALAGGVPATQGGALTETTTGNTAGVDIAFTDGAGSNDAAGDAAHSSQDDYQVVSAQISMAKSMVVVSDPVNGTTNPLAIPGGIIRYSLVIANDAGATSSAILTTISDALNGSLQIDSGANVGAWSIAGSTRTVTSGTLTVDNADGNGDGLGHTDTASPGGTLTAAIQTILVAQAGYAAGELKPNETLTVTFDVVIQ